MIFVRIMSKTLKAYEQVSYVYKWLVTYSNYNANSAYNQIFYSVFVMLNSAYTGSVRIVQFFFDNKYHK